MNAEIRQQAHPPGVSQLVSDLTVATSANLLLSVGPRVLITTATAHPGQHFEAMTKQGQAMSRLLTLVGSSLCILLLVGLTVRRLVLHSKLFPQQVQLHLETSAISAWIQPCLQHWKGAG